MRILTAVTALLLSTTLLAQGTEKEHNEALRKRIDERIQRMRQAIRDGKQIVTNVQVKVRLRNGHKITGVVKNGRFMERVDGLEFVNADMQTPGAGIRIWYYNSTNSYMFLPFEAIQSYKIGERLTEVDLREIEQRIDKGAKESKKRRADRLQRLRAATETENQTETETPAIESQPSETPVSGPPTQEQPPATGSRTLSAEDQQLMKLLQEYPPEDGWGAEKIAEIQRRKVVIGAFPDEKSERFIEVFPQWQQALRLQGEQAGGQGQGVGVGRPPVPGQGGPPLPPTPK